MLLTHVNRLFNLYIYFALDQLYRMVYRHTYITDNTDHNITTST